jgi:hypothetical protein
LRCVVLCLLAVGFARPFFPQAISDATPKGPGRKIIVLVDTSASMRRGSLWANARGEAEKVVRSAGPADQLALFTFDRGINRLLTFDQWTQTAAGDRLALALKRLGETKPGWGDTRLDTALVTAAETLEEFGRLEKQAAGTRQIVLITDMAEGSRKDGLQAYEWPKGIDLIVVPVKTRLTTNAGLQLLADAEDGEKKSTDAGPRIRVSNSSDARREQFQVGWARPDGYTFAGPALDVYVPPGQSRVVPLPLPPAGAVAETVILRGDDDDFDNQVYVIATEAAHASVLYLGNESERDATQALYFVKRAFPSTRRQMVEVIVRPPDGLLTAAETDSASLIIVADPPTAERARTLRRLMLNGKTVVLPMKSAAAAPALAELLSLGTVSAEEAPEASYAMWSEIDFQHPLFAPFADPRFSDFTKIHFWKHRRMDAAQLPGSRVIAHYDNGDPAFIEVPVEKGKLLVMTSGWQPSDSQLAVSSKFVPLLFSVLEQSGAPTPQAAQFIVGDAVPLTNLVGTVTTPLTIQKPDGVKVEMARGETTFSQADQPGVYTIAGTQPLKRFAVNLPPEESRTAPVADEVLEHLGARLQMNVSSPVRVAEEKRNLLNRDLENRQKLWRWLMVAALGALMIETWLAGRLSRPAKPEMETA